MSGRRACPLMDVNGQAGQTGECRTLGWQMNEKSEKPRLPEPLSRKKLGKRKVLTQPLHWMGRGWAGTGGLSRHLL